ncbi:MAG: hypothetical protein JO002_02075 [Burkholderiaceae bacterium]|nr:hypothetical protein [Burkholderiaceae bacterium]
MAYGPNRPTWRAAAAIMLSMAAWNAAAQTPKPLPFKLNTPSASSDMDSIAGRLGKLQQAGGSCTSCAKNGGTVDCPGAQKAFDEADAYTKHLSELYNENRAAMDDLLRHIAQYKVQMDQFDQRDAAVRDAYNKSKILSESAKLTLDLLSLSDTAKGLKGAMDKLNAGWTMTETDAVINQFVLKDGAFEAVSGTISTADDMLAAQQGGSSHIPPLVSNLQTIKGGFSDLSGAILGLREAYKKAQALGDPAKKMAAMDGAAKGVLNAIAKVGIYFAEKKQAELADEIADNIGVSKAHDQVLSDLMAQYNQLVHRMAAIARARDAAHEALRAAITCSGKCSGARQPSLVAPASDYGGGDLTNFNDGLFSPYSYGSAMKKTNAAIAGIGKSPAKLDNMCKEKDKQAAPPQNASKPDAKKPCPQSGGLSGAMENVACQESR